MCQRTTPAVGDAEYAEAMVKWQRYVWWLSRNWERYRWPDYKCAGLLRVTAEDLVQEANLLLWRRRAKFDPARCHTFNGDPFIPWVKWNFRSAVASLTTTPRRRAKTHGMVITSKVELARAKMPSPSAEAEREEARPIVRRAVAGLPRRQRNRLIRRVFRGELLGDIGNREGVTKECVRIDVEKALKTLRYELASVGP